MTDRTTASIRLVYSARPNLHHESGWVPRITENGRDLLSPWSASGYPRDVALLAAKECAEKTAARYAGDWEVTIESVDCNASP